jgi:hypothetical protein
MRPKRTCLACSKHVSNLARHMSGYHKMNANILLNGNQRHEEVAAGRELRGLLDTFQEWLMTVSGGMKTRKLAKQHRYQTETILKAAGRYLGIDRLTAEHLTIKSVKIGWLKGSTRRPVGTLRSYFSSLLCFVRFYANTVKDCAHLARFKYRLSKWSKELGNKSRAMNPVATRPHNTTLGLADSRHRRRRRRRHGGISGASSSRNDTSIKV